MSGLSDTKPWLLPQTHLSRNIFWHLFIPIHRLKKFGVIVLPHFFSLGYQVPKSWQFLCYVSHWYSALNRCSMECCSKVVLAVGMEGREEGLFFLLTLWTIWYFKNQWSWSRQRWLPVTCFHPHFLASGVHQPPHGPLHVPEMLTQAVQLGHQRKDGSWLV